MHEELKRSQEEVISCGATQYYVDIYRRREACCWLHIVNWISEERRRGRTVRCLDIGCGYGTLAVFCKRVLDCDIYCIDAIEMPATRTLAQRLNFDLKECNIETDKIPWQHKFDIVVFTEVMEHLNFNPVATLSKIANVLSDDGRLYLSTPDAREAGKSTKYYTSWTEMPQPVKKRPFIDDHIYFYSEEELRDIADQAGLRVERLEYSPGFTSRHLNAILVRK